MVHHFISTDICNRCSHHCSVWEYGCSNRNGEVQIITESIDVVGRDIVGCEYVDESRRDAHLHCRGSESKRSVAILGARDCARVCSRLFAYRDLYFNRSTSQGVLFTEIQS